jgi:hypothetical protein
MPKQHPVGFGWQPKAVTKFSDNIPRTLEITLAKTFVGTMDEAVHLIEEDLENLEYAFGAYSAVDPKIDNWSTKLIWKELYKHGH